MISGISGSINARYRQGDRYLVEVETTSGLSYELQVTKPLWESDRTEVTWTVHHHINEAGQSLFAFRSREERDLFRVLLKIHKVGPQVAIALLSLGVGDLGRAIARQDHKAITSVKGVGAVVAQNICLEASKKLKEYISDEDGTPDDPIALEVRITLSAMGYGKGEIESAVVAVKGIEDADEAIRVAIGSLMDS